MAAAEATPNILATLPAWVQVSANLGMFCVAVIAAAFGFTRHLSGSASSIFDGHGDERSGFHTTGEDIRGLKDAMSRLADAAEAMLKLMLDQDKEDSIEREVVRRLKDRQ
jgi:hypothetical protein